MQWIATLLLYLLQIVKLLVIVRCILSWFPNQDNKIVEIIYRLTEPILYPIRELIQRLMGGRAIMIDFSPILLFLLIQVLIEPLIYLMF